MPMTGEDWPSLAKLAVVQRSKTLPVIRGVAGSSLDFFYYHSYFGNIQKVGWLIAMGNFLRKVGKNTFRTLPARVLAPIYIQRNNLEIYPSLGQHGDQMSFRM
jgi:hypothetical protein